MGLQKNKSGVIKTEKIKENGVMKNKDIYLQKNENNLNVYTIGDRDIYLAGEIDTESVAEVNAKMIAALKNITAANGTYKGYSIGHVNIFIQSGGGSIHDMWGLIDFMLTYPIPIYTYAVGLTASAALSIFIAGSVRYVLPHTTLMYHDLSAGNSGKLQDIDEWKEYLKIEQKKIEDFVKTRTHMKPKQIKEIREKKKDFYIDAKQALELGFATHKFTCADWGNIIDG